PAAACDSTAESRSTASTTRTTPSSAVSGGSGGRPALFKSMWQLMFEPAVDHVV
ncbi:unnamed protein product, partial [Amoebophrya sp. A25]